VPTAVGVKEAEVAPDVLELAPVRVTGEPTGLPLVHGWVDVLGPHTVKVMVPAGAPPVALPVTVAASVTAPVGPTTIVPSPEVLADCWAVVVDAAAVTLKHSFRSAVPVLSLEPV
jgi:hypothetical protein